MDTAAARTRLQEMLADLDRSIAILKGESPERENSPSDAAAILTDSDRVEAALETMRRHRAAVVGALERIADGTYGQCVDCGRRVPDGRLKARPEAARCVACQARHDRAMR
ncbi:hypothetical protein Arub01_06180 [Actinomadura rubrobrunea]|uniref:Zinc finger DksA/TraR C4-type domain-containing protein n=1 Tax=Actinomadura rubrobrunea TaxID=115335 RepID=A0A9W6UT60_9ACTN|nr:TraR/DksA C4-type zinc finger protein [Actinomadura rubrobrunea]GLW62374.1 hypothetical protein Arub01_06180 [Actinomadura rubrobrunea]